MALERPIKDYATVGAWAEGLRNQWGGDPLAEEPEMLQALEEYCAFVDSDPDTIIGNLYRIRKSDGERVLSNKWRGIYANKVKELRTREGGPRKGADVLSFMIHNGVLIQA